MRILVTGIEGQLARSLAERAGTTPGVNVMAVGRPQFDLVDRDLIVAAVDGMKPDMVVSAAAYTAVDNAEDEPERAFAVNADGPGHLAAAAARIGCPIIHVSTDYVFGGETDGPHRETDATAPTTVYGRSKLAGEQAVALANPRHMVLRTAWVHSPYGRNFVKTMLALAATRDKIRVVDDQLGNPTSALDLAGAIIRLAVAARSGADGWGIFHLVNAGQASWADFAQHVFRESAAAGGPAARVDRITTADYPTRASRPRDSRLDTSRIAVVHGIELRHWRDASAEVVRELVGR